MNVLNVYNTDRSVIFSRKSNPTTNGKLLSIEHVVPTGVNATGSNNCIRFTCGTFDSTGNRLLIADHHGAVVLFNFLKNRFGNVLKCGMVCTSMCFSIKSENEVYMGLIDNSFRCYDIVSGSQMAIMKGHNAPISSISIHSNGNYALTTAFDSVFLWDLEICQRKRKLSVKGNVGILQVLFLPNSNSILSCFRDDSVFVWDSETLSCKYQLASNESGEDSSYRSLSVSHDARYLIAGGKSRFLHLWNLESRQLQQVIELPEGTSTVRQVHLISPLRLGADSSAGQEALLVILDQSHRMRLIRLGDCKLVKEFGFGVSEDDPLIQSCITSRHGDYIITITSEGKAQLHSLRAICQELHKPPPPMTRVWTDRSYTRSEKPKQDEKLNENLVSLSRPVSNPPSSISDKSGALDRKKLRAILKEYGHFPAIYRPFIWRTVLEFPENFNTFASLVDKGIHPAFELLHEKYPIKSQKLFRIMQKTLSALAHWSPIFGETDYLPLLAFPFIKVFQNNQVYAFEMVATILCNWCSHWFEFFPNPPINILSMVENLLAHHDRELYEHFVNQAVTTEIYAWPLLESAFSEVLTKDEWLSLWDTLICHHPGYLLTCVVAYSLCARGPLLRLTEVEEFEYFYHHRNSVTVHEILKHAHLLNSRTPQDIHPHKLLPGFSPLTKPQYPVVHRYPKFIVDYQIREKERIRQEEKEYLKQRDTAIELQKKTQRHTAEEENWYRQQELLLNAEDKRRRLISEEEEKLRQQRKRLTALNRELKLKELQLFDNARGKFRDFHNKQRQVELKRLEDELLRKNRQRAEETDIAIHQAEIRGLELAMQKRMFEGELYRQNLNDKEELRNVLAEQDRWTQRGNISDEDESRDQFDSFTAPHGDYYDKLKGPVRALTELDRDRIDDQFYADVLNSTAQCNEDSAVGQYELGEMNEKNRKLEKEIEELLNKLKTARNEISGSGFRITSPYSLTESRQSFSDD